MADRGNRERRKEVAKAERLCQLCPPNGGCNRYGVRRPRCDKGKNPRRR